MKSLKCESKGNEEIAVKEIGSKKVNGGEGKGMEGESCAFHGISLLPHVQIFISTIGDQCKLVRGYVLNTHNTRTACIRETCEL